MKKNCTLKEVLLSSPRMFMLLYHSTAFFTTVIFFVLLLFEMYFLSKIFNHVIASTIPAYCKDNMDI